MKHPEVQSLFPGLPVNIYALGAQVVGAGWKITPPTTEHGPHSLERVDGTGCAGTLEELAAITQSPRVDACERLNPEPPTAADPFLLGSVAEGGADSLRYVESMSNEDYHGTKSHLGSTSVKRARVHPSLVDLPSSIDPKVAAEGNRLHCCVCEPLEVPNRYVVAPSHINYPDALVDEKGKATNKAMVDALKAASIPKTSGKAKPELMEMCREHIPQRRLWDDIMSDFGAKNAGKELVSGSEFEAMERVAEAALAHDFLSGEGVFSDGIGESSFFAPVAFDELFGLEFLMKCRPDWLQIIKRATDLKSWTPKGSRAPEAFIRAAIKLDYDLQAAHYMAVLDAHGKRPPAFTWAVVDKTSLRERGPVLIHAITLGPSLLKQGREKLVSALDDLNVWRSSPSHYDRVHQQEHIAEAPSYGWR